MSIIISYRFSINRHVIFKCAIYKGHITIVIKYCTSAPFTICPIWWECRAVYSGIPFIVYCTPLSFCGIFRKCSSGNFQISFVVYCCTAQSVIFISAKVTVQKLQFTFVVYAVKYIGREFCFDNFHDPIIDNWVCIICDGAFFYFHLIIIWYASFIVWKCCFFQFHFTMIWYASFIVWKCCFFHFHFAVIWYGNFIWIEFTAMSMHFSKTTIANCIIVFFKWGFINFHISFIV